ncbi:MAG: transposase [Microbacteriaceae bacterium]|nr:transposase [Microbacteriaceae bacterium]
MIVAPPAYPSSRTCSICGVNSGKKELSVREWVCECGAHLDRDWNAATNLLILAARSAESKNACGRDIRLRLASASGAAAEEAGTNRIRSAKPAR